MKVESDKKDDQKQCFAEPEASSLATLLLKESSKKGNTIEISSLGIGIKPDQLVED